MRSSAGRSGLRKGNRRRGIGGRDQRGQGGDMEGKQHGGVFNNRRATILGPGRLRPWQNGPAMSLADPAFRAIFDDAPFGICVVDEDLKVVEANAAYCEMLGRTEAEVLALSVRTIPTPRTASRTPVPPAAARGPDPPLHGGEALRAQERRHRLRPASWSRRWRSPRVGRIRVQHGASREQRARRAQPAQHVLDLPPGSGAGRAMDHSRDLSRTATSRGSREPVPRLRGGRSVAGPATLRVSRAACIVSGVACRRRSTPWRRCPTTRTRRPRRPCGGSIPKRSIRWSSDTPTASCAIFSTSPVSAPSRRTCSRRRWLRVLERGHQYDPRRSFVGWLLGIARHLAIDALRRKRPASLDALVEARDGEPPKRLARRGRTPLESLVARERHDHVTAAAAALPVAYREVLFLRFQEDMALEEIARVTGAPLPTVEVPPLSRPRSPGEATWEGSMTDSHARARQSSSRRWQTVSYPWPMPTGSRGISGSVHRVPLYEKTSVRACGYFASPR